MQSAALALFGSVDEGGKVYPELNKWDRRFGDALRSANEGSHGVFGGSLADLVNDPPDVGPADSEWLSCW